MRIIPAIDILGGKCVRLTRGDYSTSKIYNQDPLEVAKEFEDYGLKYLHLVDLDGAKKKRVVNFRVIERISSGTGLRIDFGGGIRSDEDLKIVFNSGAFQATGGSIALSSPLTFLDWLALYGNEKIILGADSRNRNIAINGWGEDSDKDVVEFISGYCSKGVLFTICTDINKDGLMSGPATDLYKEILASTSLNLIASGGISSVRDIEDIREAGCEGLIIGKAIYEGRITLKELRNLC
jgi:phosphoribosylformimino-5-aminoimidazole carboxamide ribotide isomerase